MTVRAGRQAGVEATERRRFLAALGGLGGALVIAAAFVFVPSATPPPPPAPRIHVELPQPSALATPSLRAALIASRESDTTANRPAAQAPRPLAPGPRPLAPTPWPPAPDPESRPSGQRSPLPAVATLRAGTGAFGLAPPAATHTAVAVNQEAVPTIPAHALADLTRPREAPVVQVADAGEDDDRHDPVTGALVTAASHIGGGFRTMGRALRKVF